MRILLAVDGSFCSQAAVREVATRPWPDGTEIQILSAVHVPIPEIPDLLLILAAARVEMMQVERKRLQAFVEQTISQLRDTATTRNLKIHTQLIEGSPKDVIVDEALRWQADLVVMGCHGYGNVKRFFLGSVSQAVAAHAPCSVQIVRTQHNGE